MNFQQKKKLFKNRPFLSGGWIILILDCCFTKPCRTFYSNLNVLHMIAYLNIELRELDFKTVTRYLNLGFLFVSEFLFFPIVS